ncbi:MAG: hypothetical protein AKCLJLPJ_02311 [Fimbriimonadales bacterium]|nr:hypothetical protein [Armatimonadota bacterium]MBV6504209.1 hypothetical protein [Fimbriimonadales bacterium]NOG92785.1 hypothetical protein [Armatimonadota bacterium]
MISARRTIRTRGTALVVALAILFTLSALGLLFVRIVSNQINLSIGGTRRSIANDLAQAGIRYAFNQLRFSEDGADWRPQPPIPTNVPPGLDPSFDPESPAATNPDPDYYWLRQGGPDGRGAFTRINFERGRALIRVRYEPSDVFAGAQIPYAARLRAYTMIESVGRPGAFNSLDPTAVRRQNIQDARQLNAVASIGIIESARFVTNKERRTDPIEIGVPEDFGANFLGTPVQVPMVYPPVIVSSPIGNILVGAPAYFNGDLLVHGTVDAAVNRSLGDQWNIHGELLYDSGASQLVLRDEGGNIFTAFTSASSSFLTFGGVLRDILELPDPQGYPRQIPYKEPPLIDEQDPNTGQYRYRLASRSSGRIAVDGSGREFNLGRLGYGQGVYIDNLNDVAKDSEDGDFTQRFDWLNPNNGHPESRWVGPFYVPDGVFILLEPTGFTVSRNIRNNQDTWRDYLRNDTGRHLLRFKLGNGTDGRLRIINEMTPGVANFGSPSATDFDNGEVFNGLIVAEGNVRIRGLIPTNVQLTVVSMNGSIYVEGSIVKDDAGSTNSASTIALLAKDNVVVNSTQFFSSSFRNLLQVMRDNNDPTNPERVRVDPNNPFYGTAQFPVPLGSYTFTGNPAVPALFVAHAAETQQTFINLLINQNISGQPEYLFENQYPPNLAAAFYPPGNPIPTYGTDVEAPRFEKRSFQIWPISGATNGNYTLQMGGYENEFQFKKDNSIAPPGGNNNYLLSRAAIQPMDVEIHAAMYAQEGSFFVIPGPWFNWNVNDRRDAYVDAPTRLAQFQATPDFPFYGEPLDIKITIRGSIAENFPPTMADQSEWLRHWGWIPAEYGESNTFIPSQHNPGNATDYVPNLFIQYDPVLISGRVGGVVNPNAPPIRTDAFGRTLPPMPKLPVGTKLFYFGEVNP